MLPPVYSAARDKISSLTDDKGTADATLSLEQLMKLEYAAATGKARRGPALPGRSRRPSSHFVLAPDSLKAFDADSDRLQHVADAIYAPENDPKVWPDAVVHPNDADLTKASLKTIDTGVTRTIAYWKHQRRRSRAPTHGSPILAVQNSLNEFRKAEDKLAALKAKPVDTRCPLTTAT